MFNHDVHILQQINVPQHVAVHGDDVGVFAFADGADECFDIRGSRLCCRTQADEQNEPRMNTERGRLRTDSDTLSRVAAHD